MRFMHQRLLKLPQSLFHKPLETLLRKAILQGRHLLSKTKNKSSPIKMVMIINLIFSNHLPVTISKINEITLLMLIPTVLTSTMISKTAGEMMTQSTLPILLLIKNKDPTRIYHR